MFCERCGNNIEDTRIICPICGTPTPRVKEDPQPATGYGQYPGAGFGEASSYQQGYMPQPDRAPQQPYAGYASPPNRAKPNAGYYGAPPNPTPQQPYMGYSAPPNPAHQQGYAPPPYSANSIGNNTFTVSNKNDSALIVEVLLSLFGIFGVGWLIAGETPVGITLLICSIFLYWPIIILGTIFTLGFGLLCLGPLAIGGIILNALLLNSALKRKAAHFIIMQQPPVYQPRQRQM